MKNSLLILSLMLVVVALFHYLSASADRQESTTEQLSNLTPNKDDRPMQALPTKAAKAQPFEPARTDENTPKSTDNQTSKETPRFQLQRVSEQPAKEAQQLAAKNYPKQFAYSSMMYRYRQEPIDNVWADDTEQKIAISLMNYQGENHVAFEEANCRLQHCELKFTVYDVNSGNEEWLREHHNPIKFIENQLLSERSYQLAQTDTESGIEFSLVWRLREIKKQDN